MDSSLKFNSTDFTDQDIASLGDVPSAAGMTAAQLKARFDNIGKNMIAMGKHNDLVDALSGVSGASGIGTLDYDGQGNVITVQGALDNLSADKANKSGWSPVSRVMVVDSTGTMTPSGVTTTALSRIANLTDDAQSQIDALEENKYDKGGHSADKALVTDANGNVQTSFTTRQQIEMLSTLTNNPQEQINKAFADIAGEFSASKTYAAGDYVLYQQNLYRFIADHAAGDWIGTDAAAATLADGSLKRALEYDINAIADKTENLATVPTGRYYIGSAGGINPSGDKWVGMSERIPCQPSSEYTLKIFDHGASSVVGLYAAFYAADGTFIELQSHSKAPNLAWYTFSSPATAAYMCFCAYNATAISAETKLMVVSGGLFPAAYNPPLIPHDAVARQILGSTANLNTAIVGRYYTNASGETLNDADGKRVGMMTKIPCEPSTDYTLEVFGVTATTACGLYLTWYDANGAFISRDTINRAPSILYYTWQSPATAAYMIAHCYNATAINADAQIMIVKGTVHPSAYLPPVTAVDSVVRQDLDTLSKDVFACEADHTTSVNTTYLTSTSTAAGSADRARILAYNVAQWTNDGTVLIGDVPDKLIAFKKLLMFVGADAVCTNEDAEYINSANTKAPLPDIFAPLYGYKNGVGGTAIYAKTNAGFNSYTLTFDDAPAVYPKRCTLTVGEKTLYVYCIHMTGTTDTARGIQLNAILNDIIAVEEPTYWVLCGDYNTKTDTDMSNVLTMAAAAGAIPANGGYLGWLKTHKNGNPLDNMLVSDNIIIRRFEVLGNWFSDLYSDHFPIYCDLELV